MGLGGPGQGAHTFVVGGATDIGSLVVVWQGPWDPAGPKFPIQMLATLLVTMLASYHNHIHGAALLVVPGMALWARGGGPSPLPLILRLGLVAGIFMFTLRFRLEEIALAFFGLMLTTLGAIVWTIRAENSVAADRAQQPSPVPEGSSGGFRGQWGGQRLMTHCRDLMLREPNTDDQHH